MKTGQEYIESLRQLKTELYFMGEKIDNIVDNPYIRPHINSAAATYDIAFDPEFMDLAVATSHLTGEKINRFTHIQQSTEDMVKKPKFLRAIGRKTGTCFQRCVGWDAMNAVYSVSYEIDRKYGTNYHARVCKYVKFIQKNDLMVVGGMTDPKGDRSLPPHKQADPDLFVHVIETNEDGIVVRGAKAHQTGAANSHEILVMPTVAMKPDDKDYAVSFAIPLDTPGITLIFGKQTNDERKLGVLDQPQSIYQHWGSIQSSVSFFLQPVSFNIRLLLNRGISHYGRGLLELRDLPQVGADEPALVIHLRGLLGRS
jgi:4-hydroxybutyryl-CoA dehydratase/vinylacetyl-CoA-Delta-isomerase